MKKNIIFILALVVFAAVAYFVLMRVNAPAVKAPANNDLAATALPAIEKNNVGGGAGMANPASVYCDEQGGKSVNREGAGGQVGICVMPDGTECDEWDFFRTQKCGAVGGNNSQVGNSQRCGAFNCHGMDLNCTINPPETQCSADYQLGDKCRQYAKCDFVNGICQQISNVVFNACKACAQKCQSDFKNDPVKMFDCESKCGNRAG